VVALFVCATYPLALVGHLAVDLVVGDREFLRGILYGYKRIVAARLIDGWTHSLIWVAGIWLVLYAARRLLPSLHAWFALGAVALAAVLALATPLPPLFAWLLTSAVILHGTYIFLAVRPWPGSGR
jgi:hypothetical protein